MVSTISTHTREKSTVFRGYGLKYRLSGTSRGEMPPILFVGGAFQSMRSWKRFEGAFSDRTRVVTVDLPGTGDADPLPPEVGLDFLADAIRHVLDEARLSRVYLVTSSYGSAIGYRFAQLHGERLTHLVLAGVLRELGARHRTAICESLGLLQAGRMEAFAATVIDQLTACDPTLRIERQSVARRVLRRGLLEMGPRARAHYVANSLRLLRQPPLDLTTRIGTPTLVFTGEHDPFTPPEASRCVVDSLENGQFTTIREADHLFHLERPDVTTELLARFGRDGCLGDIPGCHPIGS